MKVADSVDIAKMIDIKSGWGGPPFPLLPYALRARFGEIALVSWVLEELGLPPGASGADLGMRYWDDREQPVSPAVLNYLAEMTRALGSSLPDLPVLAAPWPADADLRDLPLTARSSNVLASQGYFEQPQLLSELTYAQLIKFRNLGTRSLLEVSCVLEGFIATYKSKTDPVAGALGALEIAEELREFMETPWAHTFSLFDPRIRSVPDIPSRPIADEIAEVVNDFEETGDIKKPLALLERLRSLQEIAQKISEDNLEQSLSRVFFIIKAWNDKDRAHALMRRFGFDGRPRLTLQGTADLVNITRERVRQIESDVQRRLNRSAWYLPKLTKSLFLLESNTPLTTSSAAELLREKGLTHSDFDVGSLLYVAKCLNFQTSLRIQSARGQKILTSEGTSNNLRAVYATARRLSGASGATSVDRLQLKLLEAGHQHEYTDLKKLLEPLTEVEFYADDWFRFTDVKFDRDRLRNITRKILSASNGISISDIRSGVRRAFNSRISSGPSFESLAVPPKNVLREYYESHPEFRVDNDKVWSKEPLNADDELGTIELAFVKVFRQLGAKILDRTTFTRAMLNEGVNENSFVHYSTYSPIVDNPFINGWIIRGTELNAAEVEAHIQSSKDRDRKPRVVDFGWTDTGGLWVASRIPELNQQSLVFGIPAGVREFLCNREFIYNFGIDPVREGKVKVDERGMSYGYGPYLRLKGADEGDILKTTFDLVKSEVQIDVVDESTLEESN